MVEHVAPLTERQEGVETLEDDVLPADVLAEFPILDPVVDDGRLRMRHAAVDQILDPLVDPALEERAQATHLHSVLRTPSPSSLQHG